MKNDQKIDITINPHTWQIILASPCKVYDILREAIAPWKSIFQASIAQINFNHSLGTRFISLICISIAKEIIQLCTPSKLAKIADSKEIWLDVSHVSLSESRRDDRHPFRYLCANTQTHGGTACEHYSGDLIASQSFLIAR
ncbi:hypothetical protein ACTXT7_012015 [Hymenolepis weldensis]